MKKNKDNININRENLVKSVNKNVRSSTRKIGLILRGIVGKKVDHALRDLTFANQRICKEIKKTVQSAIANAENNFQYDIDNLFVKEAYCGKAIVMKSMMYSVPNVDNLLVRITLILNSDLALLVLSIFPSS